MAGGPSADFRTTSPVMAPRPSDPDAISSADAWAAAANPVTQGSGGFVTPETKMRQVAEAARLAAERGGATPDTQTHMAAEAARLATPTAQMAEITVGAVQDARVSLDQLKQSGAPQVLIDDATRRVEIAQAAAKIAAKAGLVEQVRFEAQAALAGNIADNARDIVATVGELTHHPDREKLQALANEGHWAESDWHWSRLGIVLAKNLQDIAAGTTPGRAELARDTQLRDAEAAKAKLRDVVQRLGALQEKLSRGGVDGERRVGGVAALLPHLKRDVASRKHLYDSDKDKDPADISEAKRLFEQYRKAASANRAEWAAAHDNAIRSGNAALQEKTGRGLQDADFSLCEMPYLNEIGYINWKSEA